MTRKHGTASLPVREPGAVAGIEIITALREGRLTRRQFEAWHEMRRRSGTAFVVTMRAKGGDKGTRRRHRGR